MHEEINTFKLHILSQHVILLRGKIKKKKNSPVTGHVQAVHM